MARQDQSQSMKANFKRKKKDQKSETLGKKKVKKSVGNQSAVSLDDVFETVVNGTNAGDTIKKSSGKGKKAESSSNFSKKATPKSANKTLVVKKVVSTAKTKQQTKKVAKSGGIISARKLSLDGKKAKSVKTPKKGLKRKSDSDVLKLKKHTDKGTCKKKESKTKCWTEVDEEVSFSSEDELTNKTLVKNMPSQKEEKPMSAKKSEKLNISRLKFTSPGKIKKDLNNVTVKMAKLPSPSKILSPKSAFKPVNRKKNQLKLSVSHLIGAKKNPESQTETEHGSSVKDDDTKFKKKQKAKAKETKKRKVDTSDVKIETDMESDSDSDNEILYSLSDSSDLGINDPDSGKEKVTTELETESGRSKSESGVEKGQKTLQKGKKTGVKKSKSSSEAESGSAKKMKLLDSLKPTHVKLVRPVSPTPVYTTVKHTSSSGNVLQSSQPLLAQPQWVLDDGITPSTAQSASLPISPASMSYKVLLENLPQQLHPKNKKKTVEKEDSDIERRVSVRASECAFKYKEIVIKKCHKYTQIWLNTHTKMKNALNPLVMQEISSALNAAKYDDSNLVMFSGLGNVFCSGIDLHCLTVGDKKVAARQMTDALRDLVRKFITFPKLIVAVVTGPAIGMGSALLPLCDIVYASDKATFYMPYAQLSQTPEGCASFTLPNIVGIAMANELLVGGRKITAIEACQLGLVSQVYWPTSMMQEVIPRIQHMALGSGKVLETTKLLVRSHQRTKLDLTNESECNLLVERWPAVECQKAIEEFLSNEKNYTL